MGFKAPLHHSVKTVQSGVLGLFWRSLWANALSSLLGKAEPKLRGGCCPAPCFSQPIENSERWQVIFAISSHIVATSS